ncbi:hypothetical protein D5045_04715 [Verminephrobacter eiseniae]|uniref:hypothetical protein n=1 Tax=Verminephrobacter eiseniae TaxID=364317 RepID=UPI0022388E4C|nr:hypothetical protein [Verminephrobacter eiseniae]MCW5259600.1 hypothetical protein [Verminephrobacter eiseniae]
MKTQIILVDLENVQQPDLLPALKMDNVQVRVFVGPQQPKWPIGLVVAMQELGERAKYIPAEQIRAAADWLKKHPKNNRPCTAVVNGLIGRAYVSVSEDKEKLRYPESLDA